MSTGDPRFEIAARPESMWFGLERVAVAGLVGAAVAVALVVAAGELLVGLVIAVVAALLAAVRVRGASLWAWVGVVFRWVADRWLIRGGRNWISAVPLAASDPEVDGKRTADVPDCLRGLDLVWAEPPGRFGFGVVVDALADTVSAVIRVSGTEFSLLEGGEQARLVGLWGRTLASTAYEGSPVVRVGWCAEAGSAEAGEHRRHALEMAADPNAPATQTYLDLVDLVTAVSTEHRSTVTVTVGMRKIRWKPRPGGLTRQARALEVLDDVAGRLEVDLQSAGFTVGGRLTREDLQETYFRCRRPEDGRRRAAAKSAGELVGPLGAGVGPLAVQDRPGHVVVDGWHHGTLAVQSWPSTMVRPSWLENFIAAPPPPGTDRRVTVTHVPVPPATARRQISRQLSSLESAAEVKHQKGFRVTAGARRVIEATRRREEALADGHQMVMVAALVTVSAASEEALEHAVEQAQSQARQAGLETGVVWLRQARAWVAGMPFGLGVTRLEP